MVTNPPNPEDVPMLLSHQVETFVKQTLTLQLRKTRLNNLVLLVTGILIVRTLCLSQISRTFPGDHTDNHKLRRLWRFLTNPHLQPAQVFPQIVQVIATRWPARLPFPILLDWTRAGDYDVLTASVPWHGRSLVLCTAVVRAGKWLTEDSRNQVEERFLRDLLGWLPAHLTPVLVADRGFGRLALFRFLTTLPRPIQWVIRIKKNTTVRVAGRTRLLRELSVPLGQSRHWASVTYLPQEDGGVTAQLVITWRRRYRRLRRLRTPKEPWYLFTSLPTAQAATAAYRRRMRIELTFRDWKSRLGMRQAQVQTVERMARLLLGLVIAYLLLAFIGLFGLTVRWRVRLRQSRYTGYIWRALQFVQRAGHQSILQAFALITPAPPLR